MIPERLILIRTLCGWYLC